MKSGMVRINGWLTGFLTMALLCLGTIGNGQAGWLPVENFESLDLGPIDEQDGWRAPSEASAVVFDPDGSLNQVLAVTTESTYLHREVTIPEATSRMLFLRFRFADQLSVSWGLSGSSYPTQFGDFEVELSLTNASPDLRINDDGQYATLTALTPDTWYNCWLQVDNSTERTRIWLHARDGEPATAADQLTEGESTEFIFRSGFANDLVRFFIKTGGGNGVDGPLYIDDLYLEQTAVLNLSQPAAPAAAADQPTPAPVIRAATPNPFNPRTSFAFTLAAPGPVRLEIHDVRGRLVAVLRDEVLPSGRHEATWEGRDLAGREAPSGVYLARLRADGRWVQTKMSLVR